MGRVRASVQTEWTTDSVETKPTQNSFIVFASWEGQSVQSYSSEYSSARNFKGIVQKYYTKFLLSVVS